jgi:hypothetical protein
MVTAYQFQKPKRGSRCRCITLVSKSNFNFSTHFELLKFSSLEGKSQQGMKSWTQSKKGRIGNQASSSPKKPPLVQQLLPSFVALLHKEILCSCCDAVDAAAFPRFATR